MTDEELLSLLRDTPHDELPPDVVQALQARAPQSEVLRAAIRQYLELESQLGGALGTPGIRAGEIFRRAQRHTSRPRRVALWTAIAIAVGLGAVLLATPWQFRPRPGRPASVAAGRQSGAAASQGPAGQRPTDGNDPQQESAGGEPLLAQQTPAAGTPPKAATPENSAAEAVSQAQEPWAPALAAGPVDFEEAALAALPPRAAVAEADLRRWFQPVKPPQLQIQRRPPQMDGLARLRAPWARDAALRFYVTGHHGLRLHVFAGEEGVTLRYWEEEEHGPQWAAFATRREAGQPQPTALELAAVDQAVCRRAGNGPLLLHWEDGQLVLSRGGVRMLSAPLSAPPQEVYVQGKAEWRELSMVRVRLVGSDPPAPALVLKTHQPASLPWSEKLAARAKLVRRADGKVELAQGPSRQPNIWSGAAVKLNEEGLREFIVQIEDATPGCGVYLANARGEVLAQVAFLRDEGTKQLFTAPLAAHERRNEDDYEEDDYEEGELVPLCGNRPWLKLVPALGVLKVFVSGDGRHWSPHPAAPVALRRGSCQQIGLFCMGGNVPRKIVLAHLEIREMEGLSRLAPAELRERAPALDDVGTLGQWLAAVTETQPADVESAAWRRACALRTLAAGPAPELGHALVEALAAESNTSGQPVESRLQVLAEAALLANTVPLAAAARIARLYERLGEQLALEGHPRPYSTITPALLAAPIHGPTPIQAFSPALLRAELLPAVHEGRWEDLAFLLARVQFFGGRDNERLAAWIASHAVRSAPRDAELPRAEALATFRHPLMEELSKEGYNILAEFEAALEGQAYDDAGEIMSTADTQGALGLLPDARDRWLLVSLSEAVALALRDHPPLGEAMRHKLGPAAKLKIHEAIAAGDFRTVQAATVQYMGTEAAALAHAWLGDRALSLGDALQAQAHYQRALRDAAPGEQPAIAARARLAAAILGQEYGGAPAQDVEYGGVTLAPAEFEQLVAELRTQSGARGAFTESALPAWSPPAPSRYTPKRFAELADPSPGSPEWAARAFAFALAGDLLLVSDGAKLLALDAASGQERWMAPAAGNSTGWPGVVSKPKVVGDRVYWRRLQRDKPEILAFSAADGKPLWTARTNQWKVVSDPLWLQEKLLALAVQQRPDRTLQLALLTLNVESGKLAGFVPLVELRDEWDGRVPTAAIVHGDAILAVLGGCVLSCDAAGQMRWVRRQAWLPPGLDVLPIEQPAAVPHVHAPPGGRACVVLAQRGVRAVQCLDLETGRLAWQFTQHRLRRVAGLAGDAVIIQTAESLAALDVRSGKPLWIRLLDSDGAAPLSDPVLCHPSGQVLWIQRLRTHSEQDWPELVWLDGRTGHEASRVPLDALAAKQLRFGPLLGIGPNTWLLAGNAAEPAKWTMYRLQAQAGAALPGHALATAERRPNQAAPELVPNAAAAAQPPVLAGANGLDFWLDEATRRVGDPMGSVLAGWTLAATAPHARVGMHTRQNEPWVAVTCATPQSPACFLRRVTVPAGPGAKLAYRVGHEGQPWRLEIRCQGMTLHSEEISPATAPQGWLAKEIDLSPLAGRSVWLVALQRSTKSSQALGYWQRLDLLLPDGNRLELAPLSRDAR